MSVDVRRASVGGCEEEEAAREEDEAAAPEEAWRERKARQGGTRQEKRDECECVCVCVCVWRTISSTSTISHSESVADVRSTLCVRRGVVPGNTHKQGADDVSKDDM